jgi:hypothetical protein
MIEVKDLEAERDGGSMPTSHLDEVVEGNNARFPSADVEVGESGFLGETGRGFHVDIGLKEAEVAARQLGTRRVKTLRPWLR